MSSLNSVTLIGNVGGDVKIVDFSSGKLIAKFSIATSERFLEKSTGLFKDETTWHNITIFNQHFVSIAKKYIAKGSLVYVSGSIKCSKYTDKSGFERTLTEIIVGHSAHTLKILKSTVPKTQEKETAQNDNDYFSNPKKDDFLNELEEDLVEDLVF